MFRGRGDFLSYVSGHVRAQILTLSSPSTLLPSELSDSRSFHPPHEDVVCLPVPLLPAPARSAWQVQREQLEIDFSSI